MSHPSAESIPWGEEMSQSADTTFLTQSLEIRLVISKNDNIKRRLSKILGILIDAKEKGEAELTLIASEAGIQKMITIVEIVKQKVGVPKKDKHGESNDRMAKINGSEQVVVGEEPVDDKPQFEFCQLNNLDYKRVPRESIRKKRKVSVKPIEGAFSREQVDSLRVDNNVMVPVMYVYLYFHKPGEEPSEDAKGKIERLKSDGWTEQTE